MRPVMAAGPIYRPIAGRSKSPDLLLTLGDE
jgi:hypothetical protein